MGMEIRILVDAEKNNDLENAIAAAFDEGKRLNMIFSDWESESELSRLSKSSQSGNAFKLTNELRDILLFSQNLARSSGGAFDVTIGPMSRLWRIARHQKKIPDPQKIKQARKRTGYKKLLIDKSNSSARLTAPGMVLDLGGIAKGYIADRMLKIMKEKGFKRCLIDAGGDLTIGDPPRSSKGWSVEIGGIGSSLLPTLELSNCAVATSGDIEQFLQFKGKIYSHLIDPRTGYGLEGRRQITVIAEDGMQADAYASTCLILGIEGIQSFLSGVKYLRMYYLYQNDTSKKFDIFESVSGSID